MGRTRWRGWAVLGGVTVALALAFPLPAGADDPAATTATTPPTTTTRPLGVDAHAPQVAVELERTNRTLADVTRRLRVAGQNLADAQSAVDVTEGFLQTNQVTIERMRDSVRANARGAYLRHGGAVDASLSVGAVGDVARGDRYLGAAQDVDVDALDQLEAQQAATRKARDERAAERDELSARQASLSTEAEQLREAQSHAIDQLNGWGAVPVMGDATLTAAQLAAWYRSTGQQPKLAPGFTIDDLARFYIEEGEAEHVRGDLAFAQGVIESAYFSVAAGNNYSGIGVCDSCAGGYGFASPRDGVRAQIQLLRNYADPDSRAANLTYRPAKGLSPDDLSKAEHVYDSFFLKGKAPLWNQMGGGNWATDPTYAPKVIGLFTRIVAFAAGSPTG